MWMLAFPSGVVLCLRMFVLGVRTGTWDALNLGDRA
jgi:hypothetical protein